jgi:prepilin peptidase CpaA
VAHGDGAAGGAFAGPLHGALASTVLALLLVAACVWDVRVRRIPNWLVLAIVGLGLANAVAGTSVSGLVWAVASVGIGLILWLPFYFLRMMGAGDVKFFGAACAWLDPATALRAALLSAVFGGVLALVWIAGSAVRQRAPRAAASITGGPAASLRPDPRSRKLPYGVAMAAGLAVAVWFPIFLP